MPRLTDKQKKKIVADYIECGNYSEVGRWHKITPQYVRKLVLNDSDSFNQLKQKKERDTADIISYMGSKTESVKRFSDYVLDERLNPLTNREELDGLLLPQLATVFGVTIDKMLKVKELSIKTAIEQKQPNNGLTAAIRESAQEAWKDELSDIQPETVENTDVVGESANSK